MGIAICRQLPMMVKIGSMEIGFEHSLSENLYYNCYNHCSQWRTPVPYSNILSQELQQYRYSLLNYLSKFQSMIQLKLKYNERFYSLLLH